MTHACNATGGASECSYVDKWKHLSQNAQCHTVNEFSLQSLSYRHMFHHSLWYIKVQIQFKLISSKENEEIFILFVLTG